MRGAWQWPLFGVLVVVDAVLLHELPIAGNGPDVALALLMAFFFSLLAVVLLAAPAGRLVRRLRADLPLAIARDYGGAAVLVAVTAAIAVAGLAHRPALRAGERAFGAQSQAVRRFVAHEAPAVFRRNIDRADSISLGDRLYRTCVPGDRPDRALCLFVDATQTPPGMRLDPSRAPNSRFTR